MSILGKFVINLPCSVSSSQSWEMVSVERELTLLLQVPGAVVRASRGHNSRAVFHHSWHTHCRRSLWLSARWVSAYVRINVTRAARWWCVRAWDMKAYLAAVCGEVCKYGVSVWCLEAVCSSVMRKWCNEWHSCRFLLVCFVLSVVRTCGCINTADGCVVHHINFWCWRHMQSPKRSVLT